MRLVTEEFVEEEGRGSLLMVSGRVKDEERVRWEGRSKGKID